MQGPSTFLFWLRSVHAKIWSKFMFHIVNEDSKSVQIIHDRSIQPVCSGNHYVRVPTIPKIRRGSTARSSSLPLQLLMRGRRRPQRVLLREFERKIPLRILPALHLNVLGHRRLRRRVVSKQVQLWRKTVDEWRRDDHSEGNQQDKKPKRVLKFTSQTLTREPNEKVRLFEFMRCTQGKTRAHFAFVMSVITEFSPKWCLKNASSFSEEYGRMPCKTSSFSWRYNRWHSRTLLPATIEVDPHKRSIRSK